MTKTLVCILGLALASSALVAVGERHATACGGCFHPPIPPTQTASDITDERMLLAVSPTQTTLYDQIRYTGNPSTFAWVLPIHGTVDVGLSADVLFNSVDELTATNIKAPDLNCVPPPSCGGGGCIGGSSDSSSAFSAGHAEQGGQVTVTKQQNVGPYETVQLHSSDPNALNAWLSKNGFVIPSDAAQVVDKYVSEGFDFLAMRLLPDQGVLAMRPVRITTTGAGFSLPLRMAAVGTGVSVGITIWVVSDGRYEPQNFPFYHIEDNELVWNFSTNLSNYTTLRSLNETALGGKGWEIESTINVNQALLTGVIMAGGQYYGPRSIASSGSITQADADYLPTSAPLVGADAGSSQSAEEARLSDIAALFSGMAGPNVRVTRMRSDIRHEAMTEDFVLRASADQSELSNQRNVTKSINGTCPVYDSSTCNVVGTTAPPGKVVGGGCDSSAKSSSDPSSFPVATAGVVAFIASRIVRARRRSQNRKENS